MQVSDPVLHLNGCSCRQKAPHFACHLFGWMYACMYVQMMDPVSLSGPAVSKAGGVGVVGTLVVVTMKLFE